MPKGHWSFLHEWVIYDYLQARNSEGTLRLKQVISRGKLLGKPKWVKVDDVNPITGTTFPDIQGVKFAKAEDSRPAEVKFTTSLFKYHQEVGYAEKFTTFIKNKGFLIVASHDQIPRNLIDKYDTVDVFEIEIEDFITFCRENFARLFNRQIKAHTATRVWIMYQGGNFNVGSKEIPPARESLVWCPTENLTGFDLTLGDRVLFFKTTGAPTQDLQKAYQTGVVDARWKLTEICIAEIKSKIFGRLEYNQYKKLSLDAQLWLNDPIVGRRRRWSRVFEFKIKKVISCNLQMNDLFNNDQSRIFVHKAIEAFCYNKSRELSLVEYRDLLESLV